MAGKTILILGGGIGGLVAAHELRRQLGPDHRIIVIDKESHHRYQASYLWLMMGWREPEALTRRLTALNRWGAAYHQAEALHIDTSSRVVETTKETIPYDYLVIALGSVLDAAAIPGLAEAGLTPYEIADAARLAEVWPRWEKGSLAVVIAALPFKCPAAPYEAAFLLDHGLRQRKVRSSVDISFYTPEPQPMPVAGPAAGQAITQAMLSKGINYHPGHRLSSLSAESRVIRFENGNEAHFDHLVYVPPHKPPAVAVNSELTDASGWIPVHPQTLQTQHEGVYALGDVSALTLANGMMLPKAGVFAHREAEVVAHNIAMEIKGRKERKVFDGWGGCFIEMGEGKAAYGSGNFLASPSPSVQIHPPARSWRLGKVALEKLWLQTLSSSGALSQGAFHTMDFGSRVLMEQTWLWRRF